MSDLLYWGIVAGSLLFGIIVWLGRRRREPKRALQATLTVDHILVEETIAEVTDPIMIAGTPIESMRFVRLRLVNTGFQAIQESDLLRPIRVELSGDRAQVLRAVVEREKDDVPIDHVIEHADGGMNVRIQTELIEVRDEIKLTVVVANATEDCCDFDARIIDGIVDYDGASSRSPSQFARALLFDKRMRWRIAMTLYALMMVGSVLIQKAILNGLDIHVFEGSGRVDMMLGILLVAWSFLLYDIAFLTVDRVLRFRSDYAILPE